MQEELKPCPFCGGESEYVNGHYVKDVECTVCHAIAPTAIWNTRHTSNAGVNANELFKELCKLGTPINCLIGAARSADGLAYYNVRQEWIDNMLSHAEEASKAWDGIVALIDESTKPHLQETLQKG